MNIQDSKDLIALIDEVIDKREQSTTRKHMMSSGMWWVGTVDVVNVGNNTATILLPNQTTATSAKQNKTNQTLVNGDEVWLFSPYGTLGSAWIAFASKQYV